MFNYFLRKDIYINIFNRIIYCFVILFSFLIFPSFLIYYSLDFIYETNRNNLRQDLLIKMNNRLEYLNKYSNNKRYFHSLLTKISQYAQTVDNPIDYMQLNIDNLRNKYPNKLQFIVWDSDGKVVNKLSDRINFNYVLKKLFKSLKDVTDKVTDDYYFRISNLDSIKNNYNLFRSFFGKIFIPENLKIPLGRTSNAGPFMTETGSGLIYVWYSIKEKISFLCFLSDDLLDDFSGLGKISDKINNYDSMFITGYTLVPNHSVHPAHFPINYEADLKLALSIFENAGDSIFENSRCLVRLSMPEPSVRTFCFFLKTDGIWDYEYNRNIMFGIVFSFLLLFYSLGIFYFLYKRHFFSIRWKLTSLFLFANLAPIAIIGFIAKDYLDSQRLNIKNELIGDLEKSIRELDARYKSMIDDLNLRLNTIVLDISNIIGNEQIKEDEINKLKSLYDVFNCSELYIVASDTGVIGYKRDELKIQQSLDSVTTFGKTVLSFTNRKVSNNQQSNKRSKIIKLENSEYMSGFVDNFGCISDFNFGETARIYYSYAFGDKNQYNCNYFFIMLWDREYLQDLFLKESYKTLFKSVPEANYYIKSNISNNSYGERKLEPIITSVLENNISIVKEVSGYRTIDDKNFVFVCFNGSYLKDCTILAVYPEYLIDKRINLIKVKIIGGIIISFLLTIIIIHVLSLHFLKPIHNLGEAALAIGDRNFGFRVPIGDKDEFGHLNQVFNRVIEGLGDFEVARIVQESLFPENHFDVGEFNIFGRSVFMTTLGGDYYDCFKINDEYLGIIIGDVAGHGIPAGLMMAMAKSAVLTSSEEVKLNPSLLTTRLNKMFYSINNKRLRRMMTFQYFVLQVKDGHFIYTNAGHCFPVIVDDNTRTATYIEYTTAPLGVMSSCRCENKVLNLEKGQSLVLYTDGIIEACNANGEQYGYDRYKECLPKHYDVNPETFYYNLYNKVYRLWTSKPDDDLTLIIINRK